VGMPAAIPGPDFLGHHGQAGRHYHVFPLTERKTRGCNFTDVIHALREHEQRGWEGQEVRHD
jgi:hypothetical protein